MFSQRGVNAGGVPAHPCMRRIAANRLTEELDFTVGSFRYGRGRKPDIARRCPLPVRQPQLHARPRFGDAGRALVHRLTEREHTIEDAVGIRSEAAHTFPRRTEGIRGRPCGCRGCRATPVLPHTV